jgi:hypothetical protein
MPAGWRRVYFFDGGGKVLQTYGYGEEEQGDGFEARQIMRAPLSNLAIERCTFRIPPAAGT